MIIPLLRGMFIFSVALFPSFFLEASLVDHLKKAEGKSDIHTMRNIDFIYTINLDQRPEKYANCCQQLNPYGIYPYRFSAVNGWELTLETINDIGLKFTPGMKGGFLGTSYLPDGNFQPHHEIIGTPGQAYFCHCMARGTIGIVLSHVSVLQDAYDSGYETIWVMEDDVDVVGDPRKLSELIDKLDKKVGADQWDILFTDQDIRGVDGKYIPAYEIDPRGRPNFTPANKAQYSIRRQIDRNFRRIGARFGAHSMIIRRSGIEKILKFMKQYDVYFPYDMDFYLPDGIVLYNVMKDVVSNQARAISDNGGPNYLNK